MDNKLVLIILDGWGHREAGENNAIAQAKTPFFDSLWHNYPHTLLNASESHVGLPAGTIGNSEIGHMTMGAGRVIDTDLVRISKAFKKQTADENPAFKGIFAHVKKYNSTLHIIGLLSRGGVHSHQEHLHEFLKAAKKSGLEKVVIHAFTDGRDVPPQSAYKYLKELEDFISDLGIGYIATATGRYYAMDRDNNWQRTEKAEAALFEGKGKTVHNKKPSDVLRELYQQGAIDELLEPVIFLDDQGQSYPIATNDGVFFFNFRTDRTRQLSKKIVEQAKQKNLFFVTMTEYQPDIECAVAFPPVKAEATLAAEIFQAGLTQSHIAETEKYAHVTYFFNGGRQEPHQNEKHFLLESRKDIKTHDEAPEMRAKEIADKTIERIEAGDNFILINFANADMVGHTANQPAIIRAVETIDTQLNRVVEAMLAAGGIVLITADHGNAEVNIDESTGEKHTAHTLNQVPFVLVSPPHFMGRGRGGVNNQSADVSLPPPLGEGRGEGTPVLRSSGSLADIAPTILELMNIKKPAGMTGKNLIQK